MPDYILLLRIIGVLLIAGAYSARHDLALAIILAAIGLTCMMFTIRYSYVRLTEHRFVTGTESFFGLVKKEKSYLLTAIEDVEIETRKLLPLAQRLDIYITLEGHQGRIHHRMFGRAEKAKRVIKEIASRKP